MLPSQEDIITITQNIVGTVLEMEASESASHPTEQRQDRITGCIQIAGQWRGALVLQTSLGFATAAAARMFDISHEDVTLDDIQDAIAELTNMVGGNVKSQVPGPSFLSLPSVTTGQDFDFRVHRSVCVNDIPLRSANEPLRILLCESIENR